MSSACISYFVLKVNFTIYLSIYLSVCLSFYLSMCLSICLSISPPFNTTRAYIHTLTLHIYILTYELMRREVVDLFADVAKDEDDLNLPVSAAGPSSEAQAAGILRVAPDSKVSQTGSSASQKNPPSEDAKLSDKDDVAALDLFWQRRSLYEVPAQLWKNPTYAGIKGLFLDRNSITTLPAEMAALKHIKMLSIADNLLTDLPDWLDAFPCLDTLAVPRNKIRKVPEVIGTLNLLKNLNVFGNEIERIPIRMANCSALTTLNLRNNPLQPLKDVEEKNLLATVVAIPANLIQLIVGGRNDDALKLLKKFWQQRLDGYYGELKRLEETREEREREVKHSSLIPSSLSKTFIK